MMTVATIPSAEVRRMSGFLRVLIERACSAPGSAPKDVLVEAATRGDAQMWVAAENFAPLGVAFSSVVDVLDRKVSAIFVAVAGGWRGMEWCHDLRRELHAFRAAEKASHLVWHGRKGWGRVFGLKSVGRTEGGLYIFEDFG